MPDNTTYPLKAIRALALHTQNLDKPPRTRPDAETIYSTIQKIGWVQIDTLQMVRRAQYVTLWSRLGSYDVADFDRLMFDDGNTSPDNGRRLFEFWMHAACIIPFTHYRHRMPLMRNYRNGKSGWRRDWGKLPENIELMNKVMAHIHSNGGARPADFEDRKKRRGTWWAWDSTKLALEHLYNQGDLTISNRIKFQRIYDIPERVLPHWVDTTEPAEEEAHCHLLDYSMKAIGVCTPAQVGDYFHMKRNESRPIIEQFIKDGTFVEIEAELSDGNSSALLVHRDNMPLLEKAADGALPSRHTTFLNPFDSLFWAKDRDMQVWNFRQILEAYKPEPIREWGYFCLPILHQGKLVGRFDPKLERKTRTLRLKKLYLEPGVRPTNKLASSVARTMRDFLAFHDATDLAIEHSQPADFGTKLMAAL